MSGVWRVFSATAWALSLLVLIATATASADVAAVGSTSTSSIGSTHHLDDVAVAAGANRLLAVGISTTAGATVTGVTYGTTALTKRVGDGATAESGPGTRAEIWTLSNPPVGSARVTVTTSGSVPAVVGATTFTGVDPLDPIIATNSESADVGANAAGLALNDTVAADGMLGVIALDNVANTSEPTPSGATDLVVPATAWKSTSGVHGSAATRSGNTGRNQALNAGINWRWTFVDGQQRDPYTQVIAGLRHAVVVVTPPTATSPTSTAVGTTSVTLGGTISTDGGDTVAQRGVVFCASPCSAVAGAPGVTNVAAATAGTGTFTVDVAGLASSKAYTFRAWASNSAGTGYSAEATFTTQTPNRAPAASAGGPYATAEGGPSVTFDATASTDADGDALTYSWDVDGDGTYGDATGAQPTLTAAQLAALGLDDGPASAEVRVRVSDGQATTTSAAATLTIADTAPTATLDDDGPVTEGSDATVTLTGATDPSPADQAAGLRYAYDLDGDGAWDVGDGTYAGGVTAATATVPTTDDGPHTVRAAVIDRDDGSTVSTTVVTATNAAPTASVRAPADTPADTALTFALGAADPSSADTAAGFTYNIEWDDGQTSIVTGPAASSVQHTYTRPGDHGIRVTATDKDGATSVAATTTITIPEHPAPPTAPDDTTPTTPASTPPPSTPAPASAPAPAPVSGASAPPLLAKVRSLSVAPRCVAAAAATTRAVKIKYQLSTAATVRVTLQRAVGARAVRTCPPPRGRRQDDGSYRPGRYTRVTSRQTSGSASGTSLTIAKGAKGGAVGTIAFVRPQALLAKGQKLKPGTYLLTVTTLGADGRTQDTARVKFWVLKG